jgi:hypothetical protein
MFCRKRPATVSEQKYSEKKECYKRTRNNRILCQLQELDNSKLDEQASLNRYLSTKAPCGGYTFKSKKIEFAECEQKPPLPNLLLDRDLFSLIQTNQLKLLRENIELFQEKEKLKQIIDEQQKMIRHLYLMILKRKQEDSTA